MAGEDQDELNVSDSKTTTRGDSIARPKHRKVDAVWDHAQLFNRRRYD